MNELLKNKKNTKNKFLIKKLKPRLAKILIRMNLE